MNDQIKKSQELLSSGADKIKKSHEAINLTKSIKIHLAKNFGKSITLELPSGEKHIITSSHNPHLYHDLSAELKSTCPAVSDNLGGLPCTTFRLPNDFDFGIENDIPLENREA